MKEYGEKIEIVIKKQAYIYEKHVENVDHVKTEQYWEQYIKDLQDANPSYQITANFLFDEEEQKTLELILDNGENVEVSGLYEKIIKAYNKEQKTPNHD